MPSKFPTRLLMGAPVHIGGGESDDGCEKAVSAPGKDESAFREALLTFFLFLSVSEAGSTLHTAGRYPAARVTFDRDNRQVGFSVRKTARGSREHRQDGDRLEVVGGRESVTQRALIPRPREGGSGVLTLSTSSLGR